MYRFLIFILSPFLFFILLLEAVKKKADKRFLKQRLGFGYPSSLPTNATWIHCASVGEVQTVIPLINSLPTDQPILITTNTVTGASLVSQIVENNPLIAHAYLPFDWAFAVTRFLKKTRPATCWIVDTEIWPNLYRIAHQRHIPISIINGRLSHKTLNAPKWLKTAYRTALQKTTRILTRCEQEKTRFIQLGANPENVTAIGNLKFSDTPLKHTHPDPSPLKNEFVLLASSHDPEEVEFTSEWLSLHRNEQLVIVPRHPHRGKPLKRILTRLLTNKQTIGLYSDGDDIDDKFTLYIDDRIGHLRPWFTHAKLVIMGGSFNGTGGHNIIEPAMHGRAIITGPNMINFEPETRLLLDHNGLIQIDGMATMRDTIKDLIDNTPACEDMGKNAQKAAESQQQVLPNYLKKLTINSAPNPT